MAYQVDFFAGIYSDVLTAIEKKKVKYPAYVFIRDEDNSQTGRFALVDKDGSLKYVRGDGKTQIRNVTELPDVGETGIIYILNNKEACIYDGEFYITLNANNSVEIDEIFQRLSSAEENAKGMENKIAGLESSINELKGTYSVKFLEF